MSNKRQIKRLSSSIEELNQQAHASLNQTAPTELETDFKTLGTAIQEAGHIIKLLRDANADEKALEIVAARLGALTEVKELLGKRLIEAQERQNRPKAPSSPPKTPVQKTVAALPKAVAPALKQRVQTEDGTLHPVALVPKEMTATLARITSETEVTINQELFGSLREGEIVEKAFEDPQVQNFREFGLAYDV